MRAGRSSKGPDDGDGAGDVCDLDLDGDGVLDAFDACVPSPVGDVVDIDGSYLCAAHAIETVRWNCCVVSNRRV